VIVHPDDVVSGPAARSPVLMDAGVAVTLPVMHAYRRGTRAAMSWIYSMGDIPSLRRANQQQAAAILGVRDLASSGFGNLHPGGQVCPAESIFLGQIMKFLASLTLRRRHRSPRHALASLDVGESRSQQGPKMMPQPDHQRPSSVPSPLSNRSSMGRPSGRSTLHSSLTVCPTCRFERCLIRSTTRGRSPTCLFVYLERRFRGLGPRWVRTTSEAAGPRWARAVTAACHNPSSQVIPADDLAKRSGETAGSSLSYRDAG
jgi:hypothetical protein